MIQVSNDPAIQSAYEEMIAAGESPRLAEMLALQKPPGCYSPDKMFWEGRCNENQWANCPELGRQYEAMAASAGVSTTGRQYLSQLADYPGDPTAWVADTADIRRVAKEKNLTIHGVVDHQGHETPGTPDVGIADDIVSRHVQAELELDPSKAAKVDELRQEVKDRLLPVWERKTEDGGRDEPSLDLDL